MASALIAIYLVVGVILAACVVLTDHEWYGKFSRVDWAVALFLLAAWPAVLAMAVVDWLSSR